MTSPSSKKGRRKGAAVAPPAVDNGRPGFFEFLVTDVCAVCPCAVLQSILPATYLMFYFEYGSGWGSRQSDTVCAAGFPAFYIGFAILGFLTVINGMIVADRAKEGALSKDVIGTSISLLFIYVVWFIYGVAQMLTSKRICGSEMYDLVFYHFIIVAALAALYALLRCYVCCHHVRIEPEQQPADELPA